MTSKRTKKPVRLPPISTPYSIRVTPSELHCLHKIPVVLHRPISQIVQAAVVEAAHRLGFYAGVDSLPKPYKGPWPDAPERNPDDTAVRNTTITIDPTTDELLTLAAEYVGVGRHTFILGATFRYLAAIDTGRKLPLPAKYLT